MVKLMKNTKNNKIGLTMTELVLVVITIGVIVALGVPQYENVMRDTRQKTAKLNLNIIKSAQDLFFDENTKYYPTVAGTADINGINTNLNLAITADILGYTCAFTSGGNDYDCRAQFPATGAADWYCRVTKDMSEAACY